MNFATSKEVKAAVLAEAIYMPDHQHLVDHEIFDTVFTNKRTVCGLKREGEILYVVYRGTANFNDAKFDVKGGTGFTPLGKVRRGFYEYCRGTWRAVRWHIIETRPKEVVFCGHSLGGAAAFVGAMLCYSRFHQLQNTINIVTFGAPRVMSREAAKNVNTEFGNRVSSFIRYGDPVPNMPPAVFRYKHSQELIFIKDGKISRDLHIGYFKFAFVRLSNLMAGVLNLAKKHSMRDYRHELQKAPKGKAKIFNPTSGYTVITKETIET